jgi:hypothetical protein
MAHGTFGFSVKSLIVFPTLYPPSFMPPFLYEAMLVTENIISFFNELIAMFQKEN